MFNIFKKEKTKQEEVLEFLPGYLQKMQEDEIREMEKYDVVFCDTNPPETVPAGRIISEMKARGYDIISLLQDIRAGRVKSNRNDIRVELVKRW